MRRLRTTGAALAALVVFAAAACDRRETSGQVEVGLPVPDYRAVTLGGEPAALSDLRGSVVLLNGWATWCIPCQREVPALEKLYAERRDDGLEIIGVSMDVGGSDARVREFMQVFGMTYPVWRDPDDVFSAVFRAYGLPASYLIGRDGILRWQHVGELNPESAAFRAALDEALDEPAPNASP